MDFAFTEEQDAVRDLAEQVFTGTATLERVKEVEASDERMDRASGRSWPPPASWASACRRPTAVRASAWSRCA